MILHYFSTDFIDKKAVVHQRLSVHFHCFNTTD
ncbi:TPA: hypothetical protein GRI80_13900 [Vibrio parahaemolyticus]|nr:hypothetical protein BSG32_22585 [Vibrio parahaemolyticus]EGQ8685160.1 hypothetical protein [Vibrio parahaemolyticus]EGQ8780385.1 hypothetical protein [Vibrio parahaemolyticus]EGQ8831329.1 hypothetical protein [Vibrio parahaemolyticus]EGQ8870764.1 hypothetical protein [Vibrio parahaemolyticus]